VARFYTPPDGGAIPGPTGPEGPAGPQGESGVSNTTVFTVQGDRKSVV
jgi:hypothetical protein